MSVTEIDFDFGNIVVLDEDKDEHEEQITCHIYDGFDYLAFCGLSPLQDNHYTLHKSVAFEIGMTECPTCNARICLTCIKQYVDSYWADDFIDLRRV